MSSVGARAAPHRSLPHVDQRGTAPWLSDRPEAALRDALRPDRSKRLGISKIPGRLEPAAAGQALPKQDVELVSIRVTTVGVTAINEMLPTVRTRLCRYRIEFIHLGKYGQNLCTRFRLGLIATARGARLASASPETGSRGQSVLPIP